MVKRPRKYRCRRGRRLYCKAANRAIVEPILVVNDPGRFVRRRSEEWFPDDN
jgi:hypothetical protein